MSPASPENATSVCLLSCLVLSSAALMMVGPRMAALEAAIKVKSLPVIPSNTSLPSLVLALMGSDQHADSRTYMMNSSNRGGSADDGYGWL